MRGLIRCPDESHPLALQLRQRLDEFYANTQSYSAFQETTRRDDLYRLLDPYVDRAARSGRPVRVLEVGAGRTAYPDYLRQRNVAVHFTAQDVTAANAEYLRERCDLVIIGDVSDVPGEYDLVLSTFVLEHVAAPTAFLDQIARRVAIDGVHAVSCPRYDFPGYLCPSLRHHDRISRSVIALRLALSRLMALLDRRPRFWVNTDPSILHGPWYRDADAVHVVSRRDVERWHRDKGFTVRRLRLPFKGVREFLLYRVLTLNLACEKRG